MADTPQNTTLDPSKHNAEVAAKVAGQDNLATPSSQEEFGAAQDALDKLAAEVKPKPGDEPPPPKPGDQPSSPKPGEQPPPKSGEQPLPPQPTPEEVATQKRAGELFKDAPALPPNASPKSSEAFNSIKIRAAQEIGKLEAEIAALKQAVEDGKKPSPELEAKDKEISELRAWRSRVDVDFDPKFKEYDKNVAQSREFIYAQLSKNSVISPAVIEQIKKYGGPDKVQMQPILEALKDPTTQRLIEAKLADIEMAKYQKDSAINTAKTNLDAYLKERETTIGQESQKDIQTTVTNLDNLLGQLSWFKEQAVDEKADEAARKAAQDHNTFLGALQSQIAEAVKDRSPEMRAILVTGMAKLFYLQERTLPGLQAELAATKKAYAELQTKWEAVKKSSQSRLERSGAPASGQPAAPKPADVNTRASDALDQIAKQVMEERAAKGV